MLTKKFITTKELFAKEFDNMFEFFIVFVVIILYASIAKENTSTIKKIALIKSKLRLLFAKDICNLFLRKI